MPPTDKYTILLKTIAENPNIDQEKKALVTQLVRVAKAIEKLYASTQKTMKGTTASKDVSADVKRVLKRLSILENLTNKLDTLSKQLNKVGLDEQLKPLINSIKQSVDVDKLASKLDKLNLVPALRNVLDELVRLRNEIKKIKDPSLAKGIDELLKVLISGAKNDDKVVQLLQDLKRKLEIKSGAGTQPPVGSLKEIEVAGKRLRSVSDKLEEAVKNLSQKQTVIFDLETSSIIKRGVEKGLAKHIRQIGYQKGTLSQLLEGTAKYGEIYIKPSRRVQELYNKGEIEKAVAEYRKDLGDLGDASVDLKEELKRIMRDGKELEEALKEFKGVLEDSSAVIGHNIGSFDLRVLNKKFNEVGLKLEGAVSEYIDTLEVARKEFPHRPSKSLESFKKDFEAAGIKIRDFGRSMHDAVHDTEVARLVLKAGAKSEKEYAAAVNGLASTIKQIAANLAKRSEDVDKGFKLLSDVSVDAAEAVKKARKQVDKFKLDIKDVRSLKSGLSTFDFKPMTVKPSETGMTLATPPGIPGAEQTVGLVRDLSKSLFELQKTIVRSLETGLSRGMQIIKDEAGKAFHLAKGGREYEIKIANVRALVKELESRYNKLIPANASPQYLINLFKESYVKSKLSAPIDTTKMASDIASALRRLSDEEAKGLGRVVNQLYTSLKQGKLNIEDIANRPDLYDLYKNLVLVSEAEKELNEQYIRRLAIPAAKVSKRGILTFETKYGSERIASQFATITTGLEKLVNELERVGVSPMQVLEYRQRVGELPLRIAPGSPTEAKANKLAFEIMSKLKEKGATAFTREGYQRAIALRKLELRQFTPQQAREYLNTAKSLDELRNEAKELKITALDAAKALDEIHIDNFYDMLQKLFLQGKPTPFIERQAGKLGSPFDQSVRRAISAVVNELQGLLPLAEPGRVKRGAYQEKLLRVFTKRPIEELRPEEQKKAIIETNLLWKDLVERAKRLQEPLIRNKPYLGQFEATSLNLSDAASSELKEFSSNFESSVRELNKNMMSLSAADVRALAPFKEFSSIQRQLSYTAAALGGGVITKKGIEPLEVPRVLSETEEQMIKSGKYGAGYGLNVLTELRHTAGTFEDQILISGRLAKTFTKIVKNLVKPAEQLSEEAVITKIKPGLQQLTPRAAKFFDRDLKEVAEKFQTILGVPQKYIGRADLAEIGKEIVNVVREHRGETIEVQTAKIAEVFLNYFGRKFATRFGTKGVSVAVKPGEALGYARIPKSMGDLLAELLTKATRQADDAVKAQVKGLARELRRAGNAFILDLFTDASKGFVTEETAQKYKKLFDRAYKAFEEFFDKELPRNLEGIKTIKEVYKETFGGEGKLYEEKPIEARISSRGIAKRGLMPEVMEGLVTNLLGASATGGVTLKDIIPNKVFLESKKAREELKKIMEELGYETIGSFEDVVKNLKLEKADLDEATINKLKQFEKQWSVYTNVTTEFGKKIRSFVAPKFLQIVEEPHLFKEWSPEEIAKGIKGLKLDYQSFAAYMDIFGEGSSMMKELGRSLSLASREGFELIKAFQLLDPSMKKFKETLLKELPTINLDDVKDFEKSTGTLEDFKDTVFDLAKFPTSFKLKIPTTTPGAEKAYEELYIPGGAIRKTYQEELLGKAAPTNLGRYLDNLISAAKQVEQYYKMLASGGGATPELQEKTISTIRSSLVDELTKYLKTFRAWEKRGPTDEQIAKMTEVIDRFKRALTEREAPEVYQAGGAITEREVVETLEKTIKGQYKYSTILGRISDLLVGANPKSLLDEQRKLTAALEMYKQTGRIPTEFNTPAYQKKLQYFGGNFEKMINTFLARIEEKKKAPTIFDIELEAGNLNEFAKKINLSVREAIEDALNQAKENLSKAKVRYFTELGKSLIGKKRGIEEAFFRRVTPAISGKAIVAVTDKTQELAELLDVLKDTKFAVDLDIPGLNDMINNIQKLKEEHFKYIKRAKELGMPVLREGEIGLSPHMAQKIKVRIGEKNEEETTLANLIKKQGKAFVESVRYPFTGTLSIQPRIAKLLPQLPAKYTIAEPGMPQLDLAKLNKIIGTLREYVGVVPREKRVYLSKDIKSLVERREEEWAKGTEEGAQKAKALTDAIEKLLKVINDATPKFLAHEQKLDFDGDALFVHTGALKESRKEIEEHYKALQDDVTSVRTLFRSVFTAVKEGETRSLSEMAYIFGKRHPAEQGYSFLTKPYLRERVANLKMPEVMQGLFSYEKAAKNIEKGSKQWSSAVRNWSKSLLKTEILPEVFSKFNLPREQQEEYLKKVDESKYGFIKAASSLEGAINSMAKELVRQQLWEKKYTDAITGQLYKLHTGQTVEGISRLLRISEVETGFGKGLAGTGKRVAPPSPEFLEKWPRTSVALGGKPVEEFSARINEILRFIIQKGMDVKHAGVKAVGTTILENVAKKGGIDKIMEAIKENADDFGELLDFEEQIANSARLRLGKLSTEQLKRELQLFEPDVDIATLTSDREKLIKRIVSHLGLRATFEELYRQIERQAIKATEVALAKQLKEMPEGRTKARLLKDISAAGGLRRFAKERVEAQAKSERGIPIPSTIVANLQPLYQMRTSMETLKSVAGRTKAKLPIEQLLLPKGEQGEKFAKQLEEATKAAHVLTMAMEQAAEAPKRGMHGVMVLSAIRSRYKELSEIEEFVRKFSAGGGEGIIGGPGRMYGNLMRQVAMEREINLRRDIMNPKEWLADLPKLMKGIKSKITPIYEKTGLPSLTPQEKEAIKARFLAQKGRNIQPVARSFAAKILGEEAKPEEFEALASDIANQLSKYYEFMALTQEKLRRINEVAKEVPLQKEYIRTAFKGIDLSKNIQDLVESTNKINQKIVDSYAITTDKVEKWYQNIRRRDLSKRIKDDTAKVNELVNTTEEAADELTEALTETVIRRKTKALRNLLKKAEGGEAIGQETELYKLFRASAIHRGGTFTGGTQLKAIISEMLGMPKKYPTLLELTSARGTLIHRNIQREFLQKFPKVEIEKPIEDVESGITGHLDVLYEKAGRKIVTDIKTVYNTRTFSRLKEIADEIKNRKITIQDKLKELKSQDIISDIDKDVIRRLEDYLSQVNVYLKHVEGAVGEILFVSTLRPEERFTLPIGKFDPARFKDDVATIKKAQSIVADTIEKIRNGEPIPKELFEDMPDVYDYIVDQLSKLGPEEFIKKLPKRPVDEIKRSAKDILGTLTEREQEAAERLSKELLDYYRRLGGTRGGEKTFQHWLAGTPATGGGGMGAAPPPGGGGAPPTYGPPPGGAGGTGGGFDDEYYKRLKDIIAKIKRGQELTSKEKLKLYNTYKELQDIVYSMSDDNDVNEQTIQTLKEIEKYVNEAGLTEAGINKLKDQLRKLESIRSTEPSYAEFRKFAPEYKEPARPEAKFKNLKAMFQQAIRYYGLGDIKESKKYSDEIYELLKTVREEGPSTDITKQIREAIMRLPEEKRGGLVRIWMLYKKEVGEYFLKRLEDLKQKIEEEGSGPEAERAYREFEAVVNRYIKNIENTLGSTSDIYTKAVDSAQKTHFVAPDLAKLVGIYRGPEQLRQLIEQRVGIRPQFKPIYDMLLGDLKAGDINMMISPIDKVRAAFDMLTRLDPKLKALIEDGDLLRRMGDKVLDAWDFKTLLTGVIELRNALESYRRLQIGGFGGPAEEFTAEARKNLEDTIKYFRQLERSLSTINTKSEMRLINVPQFIAPEEQRLLHKRNIAAVREYFKKSAAEGGPPIGKAFTYRYKIIDPATKQVLDSLSVEFRKIGEESIDAGKKLGIFTEKTEDLIKLVQGRRGFGQAFGRVIRWGVASRTVYGLVAEFKEMISVISDVQTGMAVLKQVMSPLQTDFEALQQSAVNFAKEFGLPIRQVIDAMRVFAQQGLAQAEVIDRTRSSLLAANVTTLAAEDATEALTAAVKIYGQEGQSTLKFLDAWTEVESRHAITSKNLALALRKSAAAAKTAGVTFHQLNAIVTGIGETTRQTGNEIGTSLRFIFRRLYSKKAPQMLNALGIPTMGETGELRSAFDILGDLADKWSELTKAQRLNIATAIGGRRHYNSVIVLMEHWNDVLDTLTDSINSKGASERRNAIIMDTYAKKVQQLRAAVVELQLQFGKYALPIATKFINTMRYLVESISNVSPAVKIAAASLGGFFLIVTKGEGVISKLVDYIKSISSIGGLLKGEFVKKFGAGIFEVFGRVPKMFDINATGLKVIGKSAKSIRDMETVIGKAGYVLAKFGRIWNDILSLITQKGVTAFEAIGKVLGWLGKIITGVVASFGFSNKVLTSIFGTMATGLKGGEKVFYKLAKAAGIPAVKFQEWAQTNSTFVKSFGPLTATIGAIIPIYGKLSDSIKRVTFSAEGYEKSLSGVRRKQSSELQVISDLEKRYTRLQKHLSKVNKLSKQPITKALQREEYVSPVFEYDKLARDYTDFANEIAKTSPDLVAYFDKFGNAVLRSGHNFKEGIELMRKAKLSEMADTSIKALEKFAEELTDVGTFSARFRSELKKFIKEVPAVGPILSKFVQVSPAQELKEAVDDMNKIISARTPLSPAFDKLFQQYYDRLIEARKKFKEYYKRFGEILTELPPGLSAVKITSLLDRDVFKPMYEMVLQQRRSLQLLAKEGIIDWRDVLGIYVLRTLHPERQLDFAGVLTKELARQAKILQREGEIFAGDIVVFTKDIDKYMKVAGQQGIVKFRKGLGWFVEVFDKELREVKEVPLDAVEQFIDSVFPAKRMIDLVQRDLDILKENLTGAAAGMVGISQKEFRKLYNLGPRFFENIPTEILMQTSKGINITTGKFGEVPFKANFSKILKESFFAPLDELNQLIEPLEGRLGAQAPLSKGLEEQINKLQKLISNNQIYVQLIRTYAELEKTIAKVTRALDENIAVEKERFKVLTQTAGFMAGLPETLKEVNYGIQDFTKLSPQQRIFLRESLLPPEQRVFTRRAQNIQISEMRRTGVMQQMEAIIRAATEARYILRQSQETGVQLSPEELSGMKEAVSKGISPIESRKLRIQSDIRKYQMQTVDKLEEIAVSLDEQKAAAYKREEIDKLAAFIESKIPDLEDIYKHPASLVTSPAAKGVQYVKLDVIKMYLDRLVKLRNLYTSKGQFDLVKRIDVALQKVSKSLVSQLGMRRALEFASRSPGGIKRALYRSAVPGFEFMRGPAAYADYFKGEYTFGTLLENVTNIRNLRTLVSALEARAKATLPAELGPSGAAKYFGRSERAEIYWAKAIDQMSAQQIVESKEFKELKKALDVQYKPLWLSSKTLQKLLFTQVGLAHIFKQSAAREARGYEIQLEQLKAQRSSLKAQYKVGKISKEEYRKQVTPILKKIGETSLAYKESKRTFQRRASFEALSLMGGALSQFARSLGVSEKALKMFDSAAIAAIASWWLWSKFTKEKAPKVVEDAIKTLQDNLGKVDFTKFTGKTKAFFGIGAEGKIKESIEKVKKYVEKTGKGKEIFSEKEKQAIIKSRSDIPKVAKELKKEDVKNLDIQHAILKTNKDQTALLAAIEENTRAGAKLSEEQKKEQEKQGKKSDTSVKESKKSVSISEDIRKKADEIKKAQLMSGGSVAEKISSALSALFIMTGGGYLATKSQLPNQIAVARAQQEKVVSAFKDLLEKYPGEVQGILNRFIAKREKIEASPQLTRKQKVINIQKAIEEMNLEFARLIKAKEVQLRGINKSIEIGKALEKLTQVSNKSLEAFEDFLVGIRNSYIKMVTDFKYNVRTVGAAAGLPQVQEIQSLKLEEELTPTERLLKSGGSKWKKLYMDWQVIRQAYTKLVDFYSSTLQEASDMTLLLMTQANKYDMSNMLDSIRKEFKDKRKSLSDAMKEASNMMVHTYKAIEGFKEGLAAGRYKKGQEKGIKDKIKGLQKKYEEFNDQYFDAFKRSSDITPFINKVKQAKGPKELDKVIKDEVDRRVESLEGLDKLRKELIERFRKASSKQKFELSKKGLAETLHALNKEFEEQQKSFAYLFSNPLTKVNESMTMTSKILDVLTKSTDTYTKELEKLSRLLGTTQPILQAYDALMQLGRGFANIEQSMLKIKANLDLSKELNSLEDSISRIRDMLIGGAHPLAPQYPSYEMLQAGVPPEQLFSMDKYRQRLIQIAMTQGRMPTLAEQQQVELQRRIDLARYKNQRTISRINEQVRAGEQLYTTFYTERRRAGMLVGQGGGEAAQQIADLYTKFMKTLREQMTSAYKEIGKTPEGEIILQGFNPRPIIEAFIKEASPLFDKLGDAGEKLKQTLVEGMKEAVTGEKPDTVAGKLDVISDILDKQTNSILNDMHKSLETMNKLLETDLREKYKSNKDILGNLDRVLKHTAAPKKAIGGIIRGPGGPREDKVPILASPGEYIIRADSAKKLGREILDYMNARGEVPSFNIIKKQKGGIIDENKSGIFNYLVNIWRKMFPVVSPSGDTFSIFESTSRLKKHNIEEQKQINELFERKQGGGNVNPIDYNKARQQIKYTVFNAPIEEAMKYFSANELVDILGGKEFYRRRAEAIQALKEQNLALEQPTVILPENMMRQVNKNIAEFRTPASIAGFRVVRRHGALSATNVGVDKHVEEKTAPKTKGLFYTGIEKKPAVMPIEKKLAVIPETAMLKKEVKKAVTPDKIKLYKPNVEEQPKQPIISQQLQSSIVNLLKRGEKKDIVDQLNKIVRMPITAANVAAGYLTNLAFRLQRYRLSPRSNIATQGLSGAGEIALFGTSSLLRTVSGLGELGIMTGKFLRHPVKGLRATLGSVKNLIAHRKEIVSLLKQTAGEYKEDLSRGGTKTVGEALTALASAAFIGKALGMVGRGAKATGSIGKKVMTTPITKESLKDVGKRSVRFADRTAEAILARTKKEFIPVGQDLKRYARIVKGAASQEVRSSLGMKEAETFAGYFGSELKDVGKYIRSAFFTKRSAKQAIKLAGKTALKVGWPVFKATAKTGAETLFGVGKYGMYKPLRFLLKHMVAKPVMATGKFAKFIMARRQNKVLAQFAKKLGVDYGKIDKQLFGVLLTKIKENPKLLDDILSILQQTRTGKERIDALNNILKKYRAVKVKVVEEHRKGGEVGSSGWFVNPIDWWKDLIVGSKSKKTLKDNTPFSAGAAAVKIRSRKQRDQQIMEELFPEKKQAGGFVSPIKWWIEQLTGHYEPVLPWWGKKIFGTASSTGGPFSVFEAADKIKELRKKQRQIGASLDEIPQYEKGTSYVPQTQLAIVHKGEAIIPAKYNLGGEITDRLQKFAIGSPVGGVNILTNLEAAAEKIGETIAKKIEKAEIKLQAPKAEDLPKLEISNLDDLKNIFGSGPVGADKISKLDRFIESANDKLDRLEEQTVSTSDKIKVLETSTKKLDQLDDLKEEVENLNNQVKELNENAKLVDELPELKSKFESLEKQFGEISRLNINRTLSELESEVSKLSEEVDNLYSKSEKEVYSANTKSYIDTAIHTAVSNLRRDEINPVKSFIDGLSLKLNDLNYKLDSQLDIIYSNITRLGLT